MASGLAGKVRRATASEDFDLANYDQARCDELAKGAFAEPLPLSDMVKLSFVVGGGKLVRQKYSDDLPKIFMSALAAIGLEDDSAAACEADSGGKFKFQHDTGKNLKFVHVFPRICAPQRGGQEGDEDDEEEEDAKPQTPADILFRCEQADFERLFSGNLATYGQKKRFLDTLKERISSLQTIEEKMAKLEALSHEEQALFDDVGVEELREKTKYVTDALQKMVDAGQLTAAEKAALLEQLEGKLAALEAELSKAEAEGKPKKVQVLTQQRELLQKTRASVKDADARSLPPLRHADEIRRLHRKLADLQRVEKGSKGNYTMDELKKLGERPEIEEAISVLETRSRVWFEAEEVFQERLQACLRAGGGGSKRSGGAAAAQQRSGAGGSGGFSTVSGGARAPKGKASGLSMRNGFGALDS